MTTALTVYQALKHDEKALAGWVPREMARDASDRSRVLGEVLRHAKMQCEAALGQEHISPAQAASIFLACVTFCQARIIPNKALGLGYFVPFWNSKQKTKIITPIFGYKGLRQAVGREAGVRSVHAHVVLPGDVWIQDLAPLERCQRWEPGPEHVPDFDPDKWIAGFCRMRWPDGFEDHYLMSAAEMRLRRDQSLGKIKDEWAKKLSPWSTNPVPMGAKTVIRKMVQSGQIEMAGDGFVTVADGLGEAGRLRELAGMLSARDADASDSERERLVEHALDGEEAPPEREPARTLDDLVGGEA